MSVRYRMLSLIEWVKNKVRQRDRNPKILVPFQKKNNTSRQRVILSELTFLVLTHNRPETVQRLLRYLHAQAPEISLVLVDHGDLLSQESNASAISLISKNIKHLRLPFETTWAEVLVRATDSITTKYSAFCPDDDIPILDGVIDSLLMLSTDPQVVCTQGYILSLTETESAICFGPVEDFVPSYDDEEPLKRLFSMMRRYQPVFFGFYRTEILAWSVREFAAVTISNLMLQEFFHAALVCSQGVIGRTQSISLWRRTTASYTDRRTIHPYHQLIDNPSKLGVNYCAFRDKLIPHYSKKMQSDLQQDKLALCRIFDLIFVQFLVRHIDYGELDGHIRMLLAEPNKDYFATLRAQVVGLNLDNFQPLPDYFDSNVLIDKVLLEEAVKVDSENAVGELQSSKELNISTQTLLHAIKSALAY